MTETNIFDVISDYQVKNLISDTFEIRKIRQMRAEKQISDIEYQKFWNTFERAAWLEEQWKVQEYNSRSFINLFSLLKENKDNGTILSAIKTKLNQFKEKIKSYPYIFPALLIDFRNFGFNETQEMEWDE
jgi:hypothetical protein